MHLTHLEEESAEKDEGVEREDSNSIDGVTEEFMVCLVRAMKDTQKKKNAAITVAAWTTSSMTAHW